MRVTLLPILLLAACATPAVRVETVKVNIPVPVACVDKSKVPAEPSPVGTLDRDARRAADTLAAKVLELRGYGRKLVALIGPCLTDREP